MEEKLYQEAYEEISWFLHSSPKVKSVAIERYHGLYELYRKKPDKVRETAKYALVIYRLSDFSSDASWRVRFDNIEVHHIFLRLLHLDLTNEEYKKLASKEENVKDEGSSLLSGTTPRSGENTTPGGKKKEGSAASVKSEKAQQSEDLVEKSPDNRVNQWKPRYPTKGGPSS
ncbi:hypothetical protein ASPBRDRAFT_32363 [Aspergillus brasiliensis CBS 101740]|uniref:Uncharacterized protein n=1 Tax=Aspergillus brasiliensis (strain CBS 101740 / IMI 381727 / IBT 21946) TaxID=767769 RepID=A0A1L9UCY1_ASPBC|nr:hypothetical protein ASPBRDRAFT_32363 [Aspergillus brasiliensis CBS 101740]